MKKIFFSCICGMLYSALNAQDVAVKFNSLYGAFIVPNLGVEFAVNSKTTVNLYGLYRPWTILKNNDMRLWGSGVETRYWLCEKFEGHFIGLQINGGQYYGIWKKNIYDGYRIGGGIGYGYEWILSPHWNLGLSGAVGYERLWYKRSPDSSCVKCLWNEHKNYWGITNLSISFSYIF